MTDLALSVSSLCRSFGSHQVLFDVKLELHRGTVCSLLGSNGAGKTTLLKLLMGLIGPTSGESTILGDNGLPRTASSLMATGCLIDGFEPPSGTRIDHLLSLSADASANFDLERANTLLAEKRLATKTVWKTLSKGQKRWTLLVMLLCRRCDLLLLDEPADGLDPESRQQLYQLIRREVNDRNMTALITTHIINDIERITDEFCILHQGRMIFQDNLEDLRDQVFAIESAEVIEFPAEVQLLRSEHGESASYWVRDPCGVLENSVLPGEIRRRGVGLEELYLAVTREAKERLERNASMRTAEVVGGVRDK